MGAIPRLPLEGNCCEVISILIQFLSVDVKYFNYLSIKGFTKSAKETVIDQRFYIFILVISF